MVAKLLGYGGCGVAFLGGLIGLAEYLERKIETHASLRDWIVKWLVVPTLYDAYRGWLGRRLDGLHTWMGGLWSGTAFVRCLAIAFAYPGTLLLLSYGLGGPGAVGHTEFLPSLSGWRQAALCSGLLAAMVGFAVIGGWSVRIDRHLIEGIKRRLESRGVATPERRARLRYRFVGVSVVASLWVFGTFYAGVFVAGVLALPFALAGRVALAVAYTGAFVVAGASAVALAEPADRVVASTIVLAVFGASALAIGGVVVRATDIAMAAAAIAVGLSVAFFWLFEVNFVTITLLLFFAIRPVANASLDWPSWAISRWLGQDVYDLMQDRPNRFGRLLRWLFRGIWKPASFGVHVVADLLAAVVLLAFLATLLPFLIQGFNNLVVASGGVAPLELHSYLQAAATRPWPDGAWGVSMLLTTLVPTALHAGAAIMMLLLLPLKAFGWRGRLADDLRSKDENVHSWAVTRASWLVTLTPLAAGVLVVGLGYGLVRLIGTVWEPVAMLLLQAARLGMAGADYLASALGWLPASGGG